MRVQLARNGTLVIRAEEPTDDFALHAWLHANSEHVKGAKIAFKAPSGRPIFEPLSNTDHIMEGLTEEPPAYD